MGIEEKIDQLIAALDRNTAAISGGKAATGDAETTSKGKGKGKTAETAEPKHTEAEVKGALVKLKEAKGADAAKTIIKEVGKVDKMNDLKPETFDAVFEACEKAMAGDGDDI